VAMTIDHKGRFQLSALGSQLSSFSCRRRGPIADGSQLTAILRVPVVQTHGNAVRFAIRHMPCSC
jgi:hypothetical protein